MKYLSRISNFSKSLGILFLLLTAANVSSFAQAAWTSVGSDGTEVRPGAFTGPQVSIPVGSTSTVMNYNVTATPGLFLGPNKRLVARFLDPDGNGAIRVVARLFRHQLIDGATVLLATLDSNAFPLNAAFQVQSVPIPAVPDFHFGRNSYFIQVTLTRPAGAASPGLSMLQITTAP